MLETFAVIFTLISVWLTTKRNIWCWPTGIIGIILYFFLFLSNKNWSNTTLQIVFLIQSIYGWIKWNQKDKEVTKMDPILTSIFISQTMLVGWFFYVINTMLEGEMILLDSVTTSLSIIGMILLAHRRIQAWFWWMIADIFYIPFFFYQKDYQSAAIYFIFFILTIFGYKCWKNEYIRSNK